MRHLDVDILQAVINGDLPPKTLLRHLLAHVGELCPDCGEAIAMLRRQDPSSFAQGEQAVPPGHHHPDAGERAVAALPDPRLVGAVDRAERGVIDWSKRLRRERRRARAELQELRAEAPELRAQRVERARSRFRSRSLAELLIEESGDLVRDDPAEALNLAALVDVVLLWTPGAIEQDWARDLSLQAAARQANALRVAGSLRAADRAFAQLRERLASEVSGSEELHAEVCSLEASLRIEQRRLEEARGLLDRSAFLYRQAGARQPLAKVLMKLAIVETRQGDFAAAVDVQERALRLIDPDHDRALFLSAMLNLGLYLHDLEQDDRAEELLATHREALTAEGLWEWPNTQALRGRLALSRGDEGEAERLFVAAREELIRRGDAIRAAVASLDLAVLYLSQGRTAELRRMAGTMEAIFEAEDLHEEALATTVLFQRAVAAESVTIEAIRGWRRQLERGSEVPKTRQPS